MGTIEKQWVKVDTYKALRVSDYNGNISIMLGNRGDQDTSDAWCFPAKWKNGENVRIKKKDGDPLLLPFQLPLGTDKEQALKIWENIGNQLKRL